MCFSPEASFTAGAALLPAGIYCTQAAVRKDARFVPLALVPFAFGIQQISEGFVWLGLNEDNAALVQQSSTIFLFFAIAFWPCWIPLSLAMAESRHRQQIALALFAIVGLAWLWLYFPLAVDPSKWLAVEVVQHSIRYNVGELPGFALAPRFVWRLGYLLIISVPLAIGRFDPGGNRWANLTGGVLVALLFGVSYGLYWHAFLSVWCFFAAFLSLLLCGAFYRLPVRVRPSSELLISDSTRPITG
jgi:hypothetical protein